METTLILNFLHVKAKVKVWKVGAVFFARIWFPKAYMEPGRNNYQIDGIAASNLDNACEMAALMFKERYYFLNKPLRRLHREMFFVHRAVFQLYRYRRFEDERFGFRVQDQVWAISEKVDGKYWFRSQFMHREELSTKKTLLWINYQKIFEPMKAIGFSYKFIERILDKYNTTPLSALRLHEDSTLYILHESVMLIDHVRLHAKQQSLGELMFLHKVTKDLKKPFIP